MLNRPSENLVRTLAELNLAGERDLARVAARVRRLARQLPGFDSVWIDALAQSQVVTAFQASELHADRGRQLQVGPYLLRKPIQNAGCGIQYEAIHRDTRQSVLLVVLAQNACDAETSLARLRQSITTLADHNSTLVHAPHSAGYDRGRLWAAGTPVAGDRASHWLADFGRFPGEVILEIARQLVGTLVALEYANEVHGEIAAYQMVFLRSGRICLPMAGWKSAARPTESYAKANLPVEAYDGLAPERLIHGTPPNVASEIYACGALLWQLAAGRPALPGGNALGKLRAAQEGCIPNIRRYAPDLPDALAKLICHMVELKPGNRPQSFAEVAVALDESKIGSPSELRKCLRDPLSAAPRALHRTGRAPRTSHRRSRSTKSALQGAALLATVISAVVWLGSRTRDPATAQNVPAVVATAAHAPKTPPDGTTSRQATPPSPETELPFGTPAKLVSANRRASKSLVLPAGVVSQLDPEELEHLEVVRAEGGRAVVELPAAGLTVLGKSIEFEDIDFVWPPAGTPVAPSHQQPALLILRVRHARFVGCRFRAFGEGNAVAIRWQGSTGPEQDELTTGLLEINRSVLENVTAVQLQTYGATSVRATGTLHLGPGPLVRMSRCPATDEPLSILLERCTLRGAAAVLECRYRELEEHPGTVSLHGADCVFAGDNGSLLVFEGPASPQTWLPSFAWRGQGSVIEDAWRVLSWHGGDGTEQIIDEQRLLIEGLVRSRLEFAGPAGAGPAASRLTRCLAPLRSVELPGIQGSSLPHERP